jgi:predicted transcriptional regulator
MKIKRVGVKMEEQSLKDLFHLIKQALPEPQELLTFTPEKPIAKALAVMHEHNFSQVPVVAGNEVLGIFSYKSFAERVTKLPQNTPNLMDLPVEEFLDDLKFARITDQLTQFIDEFELKDAVLVGSEDRLQGIITTIDILRYFYQVASPYFMLREIELAIRALMKASVSEEDLRDCIDKSLKKYYEENNQKVPDCLEELTLRDYVTILRYGDTWEYFMPAFGKRRRVVYARIDQLPRLRNDVFHFKRDITVNEYNYLKDTRNWLLKRITKHEAYGREIHQ